MARVVALVAVAAVPAVGLFVGVWMLTRRQARFDRQAADRSAEDDRLIGLLREGLEARGVDAFDRAAGVPRDEGSG